MYPNSTGHFNFSHFGMVINQTEVLLVVLPLRVKAHANTAMNYPITKDW